MYRGCRHNLGPHDLSCIIYYVSVLLFCFESEITDLQVSLYILCKQVYIVHVIGTYLRWKITDSIQMSNTKPPVWHAQFSIISIQLPLEQT